ncbi:PrgI family mobile element protein [Nocardia africana]|uniref:PrgI family mobile element protein n=1 Tax=Nocardia africana TaxID=134964 RepID=A0ABW6NUN8_9NOCA
MNSYRIPSDVERPDRIVGPFTARQLGLLAGTGLVLLLAWAATRAVVPITVFAGLAAPVAAVATAIVLTTRDGLSGDQLLLAALRHLARDRHLIAAHPGDEHNGTPPRWLTDRAHGPLPPAARPITSEAAALPRSVTPGSGGLGVVDLGEDGIAVIAAATTINLVLRTPAEQAGLVAALGNYLQSLSGHGVQILLRSVRQDVTGRISDLRLAAREMSPELADYARDHAQHLAELADDDSAAQRQVLLVWREPFDPATRLAASVLGGLTARGRHQRRISAHARHAAETRLAARLTDAADMLAPLGIGVRALDEDAATAVVASCTNPANLVPFGAAEAAGPTEIITTGASEYAGVHFDASLTADDEAETPRGGRRLFGSRAGCRGASVEFAPESLTIGARHLQVGSDFIATIAVTGYPREVTPGWLAPLAAFGGRVDIALHIEPIDPRLAAVRLRRQLARLESSLASAAVHNRVGDPAVDVAAEDAAALSAQLARGESRLFRAGLYLTVHASSEEELAAQVGALRTLAASLLIDTCPTSYRAMQGWTATLPLGLDPIRLHRTFDSHALAAAVPFASAQLPPADPVSVTPTGVLYGRDGAAGLLFHDRFGPAMHNHNEVILGRSGSGKSYLSKTSILRSLYRGVEILVIDPEDEYAALCDALGGTLIRLGAPGVCLNPFDLDIHYGPSGRRTAPADALIRRKLYLHTVIAVLLGEQTPAQRAALDTAVTATYAAAGITDDDPSSWVRPAPTLSMLRDQLAAAGSPVAVDVAAGLAPYVAGGAFAGLLDGASSHGPAGGLTVYSLRDLPDELRTIGTLLALDATWRQVSDPGLRRPRSVVVDEAWLLMRQRAGAEFLARLAKSARKYFAGLTVATQDAADVLATDLGKAIVANAATQVLLRQAPQAIDQVGDAFALSEGERRFLLAADRGQGLICTGVHQRTVFASVASAAEHQLATTSPEYDLYDTDETDYDDFAPGAVGSEIDLGPDEIYAGTGDEDAGAEPGDDLGPDEADTQETP